LIFRFAAWCRQWNTAGGATFPLKKGNADPGFIPMMNAPRKTPDRGRGAFALGLASHAAMGTAMGLGFCLLAWAGRPDVANMIAHDATPKVTAIALIGFTSLMFAVGATLTGMVPMTLDES
jgi:hypothetical protein